MVTKFLSIPEVLFFAALLLCVGTATAENVQRPHSLYMRRLREHLSDYHLTISPYTTDRNDSVQGKLVATSIETQNTTGRGYSENGFAFDETNEIQLEFPIPKVSTTGDGPEVELWILPDKSQTPPNKVDKITFRAVADIPQASNPRIHIANLLWNTNQDCVQLNLTSLSRKISKILQKKNLNETIMSLAVSIVRVEELEGEFQPNASVNPFHHDLCNSMLQRESNDSFLVIKNYDERGIQDQFSQQPGPPASASAQKSHNNDKVLPMGLSAAGASVSVSRQHADSSCGVVPLVVNLTDVYGDFIKAPIVIDVRDCSGRCTLLHDSSKFSKHGEIKERLKFLPGGESLSNYEPSCTPIKFQPLQVLIGLQAKSDVIVQMSDLVVDRCACQ